MIVKRKRGESPLFERSVKALIIIGLLLAVVSLLQDVLLKSKPADPSTVRCTEEWLAAQLDEGGIVTIDCMHPITLTREIVVRTDTKLIGQGTDTIISGLEGIDRLFTVADGAHLQLRSLQLVGGAQIGVFVEGESSLNVVLVHFRGHTGEDNRAALWNEGMAQIESSVFEGNSSNSSGAAIINEGVIEITGSLFQGNESRSESAGGAALLNTGFALVADSIFNGNRAPMGSGGAIVNTADLEIINSQFSGNEALVDGGAVVNERGGIMIMTNNVLRGNASGDCSSIINDGMMEASHQEDFAVCSE